MNRIFSGLGLATAAATLALCGMGLIPMRRDLGVSAVTPDTPQRTPRGLEIMLAR